ncbi:hypothetical protein BS78_06G027100 [Paspalum vaginatum]|nr:hypothetical protein BS78_06G027100 [Paspalum vaginatum]
MHTPSVLHRSRSRLSRSLLASRALSSPNNGGTTGSRPAGWRPTRAAGRAACVLLASPAPLGGESYEFSALQMLTRGQLVQRILHVECCCRPPTQRRGDMGVGERLSSIDEVWL